MTPAPSWIPGLSKNDPFGIHNLAYGVVNGAPLAGPALVARIGNLALVLGPASRALSFEHAELLDAPSLNRLLAARRPTWTAVRQAIMTWLSDESHRSAIEPNLLPLAGLHCHLPFEVADYVDFYGSEHHATNVGRILRPGVAPLPANWKHLPIGYHGRAGTVVVSGTDIVRPRGQRRTGEGVVEFGPTERLDLECEVGFVVGGPTGLGDPVPLRQTPDHIFGVCLVNDWSARDIQAWEYVPLGPFLGKSFATSVSPWIVPLEAFGTARVAPPPRSQSLLAYLDDSQEPDGGLEIELMITINGTPISAPQFASQYWTAFQQLAHLTVNGSSLRAGDLIASGTVSGPEPGRRGSLLELTVNGTEPITLGDGGMRGYLADGDEVVIAGHVPGTARRPTLGLGEVRGRIVAGRKR